MWKNILDWILEVLGLQRKVEQGTILGSGYARSWFRITVGDEALEGIILDGDLQLTTRYKGETISIKVSSEHADKIVEWLLRQFPQKPVTPKGNAKNVIKLTRKLPVPGSPRDTDPGSK